MVQVPGAAGDKMLNETGGQYSCGTNLALWTSWEMPTEVGVEKKIYVYIEYTRARVNGNRVRGYTL